MEQNLSLTQTLIRQLILILTRFDPAKPMQVGGQAVIEGVMMRAPGRVATAVRRKDGTVVVQTRSHSSLADKSRIFRQPILRGAVGLFEMLILGIETLNYSAEIAASDDRENAPNRLPGTPAKRSTKETLVLAATMGIALIVGTAIFFATPLIVSTVLFSVDQSPLSFNLTAGVIRLLLFMGYLLLIARMKEIQRIFAYHGAEHKSVFAYEQGAELTSEAAAGFSRFHPRCGTSFLLVVMIASIVLFGLLDTAILAILGTITLPVRLVTHLLFVPVVGGLSYEMIKFSARHGSTWWGSVLVAPGLWLQRITTVEPDGAQLEVAMCALRAALGQEIHASVVPQRIAESRL